MNVPEFFEIFIKELEINADLRGYYRLLDKPGRYLWRKAYLEQRLTYVHHQLGDVEKNIWDAGCGYGTTAIFAALNGHRVEGSTLEFYFDQIRRRLDFWSRYGDLSHLRIVYENLFDRPIEENFYDAIIVQDTLHHLEPIDKACAIFMKSLKAGGKLIVSEENGNNPFIIGKNLLKRGFNRVGEMYDERLGKAISFGNENARGLIAWKKILERSGFTVPDSETRFVRLFPPFYFNDHNYSILLDREKATGLKSRFISRFFYFGINFAALKNHNVSRGKLR